MFLRYLSLALIICSGTLLLTVLLSVRSWYKPTIKLNEPSPVTIVLDRDVRIFDKVATDDAKEKARLQAIKYIGHGEILDVDYQAFNTNLENLKFVIHVIRHENSLSRPILDPINSKISLETQIYLLDLNDKKFNQIILNTNYASLIDDRVKVHELSSLTDVEKKLFFQALTAERESRKRAEDVKTNLGKSFFDTIRKIDYESIFSEAFIVQKKLLDLGLVMGMPRAKIHENINILYPNLSYTDLNLIYKLIDVSTTANVQINWNKLHKIEKEAIGSVEPIKIDLKRGSLLATKGQVVEPQIYYYLAELHKLNPQTDWKQIRRNFIALMSTVLLVTLLVSTTKFKQYSIKQVMMMFLVPAMILGIIAPLAVWDVDKLAVAPIATVAVLLTLFYAPNMAIIISVLLSFFMVKALDMNFWQVLPHLVGSLYAAFLVRKVHQRQDLTNASIKVAIVQVLVFLLTVLIAVENFKVTLVLFLALLYALSAIASGFIAMAVMSYLETSLALITPFKLAELSNPNQPLLLKLKELTPGTYEHSVNVSRFSEEAGLVLGLNTELIRVGLLYHDIGKMHAPEYFIENTLGKPNPHNALADPYKSAQIIVAHVTEGIKLGKKYNLPQEIMDFIPMHQGTTITNYFYRKAKEKFGEENVSKKDFRYPGPKPKSKETGIAMIADSTEAALRSIKDFVNEDSAKAMIYKIINDRVDEGELEDSGLNRSELDKVAESFLKIWRSQNHERIQYPPG